MCHASSALALPARPDGGGFAYGGSHAGSYYEPSPYLGGHAAYQAAAAARHPPPAYAPAGAALAPSSAPGHRQQPAGGAKSGHLMDRLAGGSLEGLAAWAHESIEEVSAGVGS